jgi:hypothetical protein
MAANPVERKCWTIQHVYADKRQDGDTFDTTAVYFTAEYVLEAIHATIDELEETINLGEHVQPTFLASKEYFTIDMLNNMEPNNWRSDCSIIYEYPNLIVAVVVRVLV